MKQNLNFYAKRKQRSEKIKEPEWLTHKFNYLTPTQERMACQFLFDLLSWKPTGRAGGGGWGAAPKHPTPPSETEGPIRFTPVKASLCSVVKLVWGLSL